MDMSFHTYLNMFIEEAKRFTETNPDQYPIAAESAVSASGHTRTKRKNDTREKG